MKSLSTQPGIDLRCLSAVIVLVASASAAWGQFDYDKKPIEYSAAPVADAVFALQQQLASGEKQLAWDRRLGWLPAVLDELGVPANSQTLVFSKTSLQRRQISPDRPRALYYNDDVYVGYVRHGQKLELSAVDPHLGAVFYTIDQKNQGQPVVTRDGGQCLSCHATRRTRDVPGYLIRSVYADRTGEPMASLGSLTTDHKTPLSDRFGGWYVTGSHGAIRHRGNAIADSREEVAAEAGAAAGANRQTLDGLVDTRAYLEPGSDLVALMVLEHQATMHNLITRAAYQARTTMYLEAAMNQAFDRPAGYLGASSHRRIQAAGESLLEYLFFSGEAPLASPITGSSSFAKDFAKRGPTDSRGRSLREFDLTKRLFRYPCSFLIYSESIDALPAPLLEFLKRRLNEILSGEDKTDAYAHLSPDDRRAILQILRDTKPALLR